MSNKKKTGPKTLCTPELVEQARAYITDYNKVHEDQIPSLVGLARVLGLRRETFYLWAKEKKKDIPEDEKDQNKLEFSEIMEEINEEQERVTLNHGLVGVFTPVIAKLVLAKHGYHDKQDTSVAAPDGGPVKAQFNFIPVGPNAAD